jgi:Fic family protein
MAIRLAGDWEGWLRFFLTGVAVVAREAEQTARQIVQLREDIRKRARAAKMSATAFRLLDHLFQRPFIDVNAARDHLGMSYVAANSLIGELCEIGVLSEITGGTQSCLSVRAIHRPVRRRG